MGVLGWVKIGDDVTLIGTLKSISFSGDFLEGDQDWNLDIEPDPGHMSLLQGPGQDGPNAGNVVECEVQPLGFEDSESALNGFFGPLIGRTLTVNGTWVHDRGHPFDGGSVPPANPLNGKTEIHPVQLVVAEHDPVGSSKDVEIWVMTDASQAHFWIRRVRFRSSTPAFPVTKSINVPFPLPTPGGPSIPSISVVGEVGRTRVAPSSASSSRGSPSWPSPSPSARRTTSRRPGSITRRCISTTSCRCCAPAARRIRYKRTCDRRSRCTRPTRRASSRLRVTSTSPA